MKRLSLLLLVILSVGGLFVVVGGGLWFASHEKDAAPAAAVPVAAKGDPDVGRELFVSEACVACHAVRGVGGKAGPPLDVTEGMPARDPMDFAAAMWMGAPVMLRLQDAWVGYQIDLTGEELRHLAAFANDPAAQDKLTEDDVPEEYRNFYLDQFYIDEDLEGRYRGEEWIELSRRKKDD